jgi:cyclohexadieny/prephenate dehydrogenase
MLRKLTIIGPGLLGGSIGMAARNRKLAARVAVWARRPEAADQARQSGAADEISSDLREVVTNAELVVLATPIGVMRDLAEQMKPALEKNCVVTDVGSVKYPVVVALTDVLAGHAQFVGSHPMAGSEQSGIEAARADLFERAVCILTPTDDTDKTAVQRVHDFWKSIGCTVWTISPQVHDEVIARVSHLPHVLAAALVNTVCAESAQRLRFVGPGFRDSTRVAAGPPPMWTEICIENRHELARALDEFIEELQKFRAALENADAVELQTLLKRAKHFRDELKFRQ